MRDGLDRFPSLEGRVGLLCACSTALTPFLPRGMRDNDHHRGFPNGLWVSFFFNLTIGVCMRTNACLCLSERHETDPARVSE